MDKNKTIHFTGIKGAGMSALAQLMCDLGYKVKGSDVEKYFFTQQPLEDRGVGISSFNPNNILSDDVVVASKAFEKNNLEVQFAKENNEFYFYHSFLDKVINQFKTSIAVSGSHGKTTTTGLLSHVLGTFEGTSLLIGDGTGKGEVDSSNFVFEACEYKNHFLSYYPDYAIITNIDFDHPDFFEDKQSVVDSFQRFVKNVSKKVIIFGDQPETKGLVSDRAWYYGLNEENDMIAKNISVNENGTAFDVYVEGERWRRVNIPMVGTHHVMNALSVCSLLYLKIGDIDETKMTKSFMSFNGTKRRFDEFTAGNNVLIDDYAHHPTEIEATLESIRLKYPEKKAVVLFQPHTYTRTKSLLSEFASSLQKFDDIYLADVFGSARESSDNAGMVVEELVEKIGVSNVRRVRKELPASIKELDGAAIAFLGAGDVTKYRKQFLE